MIDEDVICAIVIIVLVVLGLWAISPNLENHRNERLELMRKYPECAEAAYPVKCVRYKRMLER